MDEPLEHDPACRRDVLYSIWTDPEALDPPGCARCRYLAAIVARYPEMVRRREEADAAWVYNPSPFDDPTEEPF